MSRLLPRENFPGALIVKPNALNHPAKYYRASPTAGIDLTVEQSRLRGSNISIRSPYARVPLDIPETWQQHTCRQVCPCPEFSLSHRMLLLPEGQGPLIPLRPWLSCRRRRCIRFVQRSPDNNMSGFRACTPQPQTSFQQRSRNSRKCSNPCRMLAFS
jgi:hypothetical protein